MRFQSNWFGASALMTMLAITCGACSSSSSDGPASGTDAAGTDTAVTPSDGAGGTDTASGTDTAGGTDTSGVDTGAACTPITPAGAIINKDHDPGPPPAMTGGTIADGTYALTKMVQYNGETGNTAHKDSMVFAGGNGQVAGLKDGTGPLQSAFFTFTTAGNELTLTMTCGGSGTVTLKYTATATTITTVNAGDPNELHTFTKM